MLLRLGEFTQTPRQLGKETPSHSTLHLDAFSVSISSVIGTQLSAPRHASLLLIIQSRRLWLQPLMQIKVKGKGTVSC